MGVNDPQPQQSEPEPAAECPEQSENSPNSDSDDPGSHLETWRTHNMALTLEYVTSYQGWAD